LRRGLPVCLRDSSAALLLAPPSPTSTYTLSLHDAMSVHKIVGGLTVKKSLVRKYLFALIAFVLLAGTVYQPVRAQAAAPIDTTAEAAILVDAKTGRILYEKNADKLIDVTGVFKMMVKCLLFKSISDSLLKWDDTISIPLQLV